MTKQWEEQLILFISLTKWTVYASVIGLIVGISAVIFLKSLDWSILTIEHIAHPFYLAPLFLVISSLLIEKIAPSAAGYGTDRLIDAVHNNKGKIDFLVVPVKLIASILTIASGGSAGKIGPCGQIGAGIASKIASILKIDDTDRRKLVVCGISAGFAAVFGTPIGGALFGLEVLFLGRLLYEVLFPAFIAGVTAYQVATFFQISYFHQLLEPIPYFSEWLVLKCILFGLLCGLVSLLFINLLESVKKVFLKVKRSYIRSVIGGCLLILIAVFLSPAYLGLGVESIQSSLQGAIVAPYGFLAKIITTAITFAAGGSGGIILPIVFIGSFLGNFFAQAFGGMDIGTFSAIGMVALLAASTNTPVAAIVMAMELFGPEVVPYAAVTCSVSYLIVGHHSIFPTQVLVTRKSATLFVDTQVSIQQLDQLEVKPHGAIWVYILKWLHLIKK